MIKNNKWIINLQEMEELNELDNFYEMIVIKKLLSSGKITFQNPEVKIFDWYIVVKYKSLI